MQTTIDDTRLKALLKEAIIEVFEERNELFYNLLAEILEDIGLIIAIKEGEKTPAVGREEIFKILEGQQ